MLFFFLRVRGNVGSFVGWLLFDCRPIFPVFSSCSVPVELLRVFRGESGFSLLTRSAKWPSDRESRPSSRCSAGVEKEEEEKKEEEERALICKKSKHLRYDH